MPGERAAVCGRIAAGLRQVGVKAGYVSVEFGDLVTQLTASYDWEAVVIGFSGGADPYSGIVFWHSSEIFRLWRPNQPAPATAWEAEIHALYVQASQELDHATRVTLYHQAQAIAAACVPVICTTQSKRLTAARNVFGNTTPTLYGIWDVRYVNRTDQ